MLSPAYYIWYPGKDYVKRNLGCVQDSRLPPWQSALDNAALGVRAEGMHRDAVREKPAAILDALDSRDDQRSARAPFQEVCGKERRSRGPWLWRQICFCSTSFSFASIRHFRPTFIN